MKKKSILNHLLLISIAISAVPVAASLFFFSTNISSQLEASSHDNVTSVMEHLTGNVADNMSMLNSTAHYLMASDLVQSVMERDQVTQLSALQMESDINSALTYNFAWSRRFINSLTLFKEGGAAYSTTRESAYAGVRQRMLEVYRSNLDFSSTHVLIRPEESRFCYYIQDYYQIDIQKKVGKIVIEVNIENLIDAKSKASTYENAIVLLSTLSGDVLYCSDADTSGARTLQDYYHNYLSVPEDTYYHRHQQVQGHDLQIDIFIPYAAIMHSVISTRNAFVMMEIAILVFLITLTVLLRHRLRRTMGMWLSHFQQLADGQFGTRLPSSRYSELDEIAITFNRTAEQLSVAFQKNYEAGLLLNRAEYQMLESQINPHFILNVLETINMSCLLNQQTEISTMVVNLGMMLKSNIIMKEKMCVTLHQELEYAQYYLALQKSRFANLNYSIHVEDEDLLNSFLPKLTLQPIVENSIVHGLEDSKKPSHVNIYVWEESEDIYIRVSDNGKGFDTSSLNFQPDGDLQEFRGSHVALRNIQRRIELLYGCGYGIEIDSTINQGTHVLVHLPIDRQNRNGEMPEDLSC